MSQPEKSKLGALMIGAIAVSAIWIGAGVAIYHMLPQWSERGQFGDMFGAVNALFSGLAFGILIFAIWFQREELGLQREELQLQRKELELTRKELQRSASAQEGSQKALHIQNFERTFFEMVRLHNDIVKDLDFGRRPGSAETMSGRNGFRYLFEIFGDCHGKANTKFNRSGQLTIVQEAYSSFHYQHQQDIGHYFRNFYRILKFVDNSPIDDKTNYTGILRAQMSSFELALLFYNSLHPLGINLKPLIEQFAILENMDPGLLRNSADEVCLFKESAFGDQDVSNYYEQLS